MSHAYEHLGERVYLGFGWVGVSHAYEHLGKGVWDLGQTAPAA